MDPQIVDTDRLLNLVSIFGLLALVGVLSSVRRSWIRAEYSVSWLLAAAVLLGLGRSRALAEWITGALGVGDVAVAVLILVVAVFIVVLYRLSLLVSALKDSNVRLAQRVAALEFGLGSLDGKAETGEPSQSIS